MNFQLLTFYFLLNYQEQERQDELGLNWDSFKYRNYDYAIGRFFNVDPLAEKYPYNSTYAFQENKMGLGRELEGKELDLSSWLINDAVAHSNGVGAHVAGFAQGVINSVKETYNAITHPVHTLKGMANVAVAGVANGNIPRMISMDNTLGTNSFGTTLAMTQGIVNGGDAILKGNGFQRGETLGNIAGTIAIGEGVGMTLEGTSALLKGSSITNPVPSTLARVVPANVEATTLGAAGASDVFVTAASDISGLNAAQISNKLTIPQTSSGFKVIEFSTPETGLASPINRTNPGFVGRGRTAGGAREFTVPNQKVPSNAIIKKIN